MKVSTLVLVAALVAACTAQDEGCAKDYTAHDYSDGMSFDYSIGNYCNPGGANEPCMRGICSEGVCSNQPDSSLEGNECDYGGDNNPCMAGTCDGSGSCVLQPFREGEVCDPETPLTQDQKDCLVTICEDGTCKRKVREEDTTDYDDYSFCYENYKDD